MCYIAKWGVRWGGGDVVFAYVRLCCEKLRTRRQGEVGGEKEGQLD